MGDLNSGSPNTSPSSGRKEDLNSGPPDYKASTLTNRPRRRLCLIVLKKKIGIEIIFTVNVKQTMELTKYMNS